MAITVGDFFEAARKKASLELVIGEKELFRLIMETAINRPGLALTGYFEHFAFRRIQVLGLAEYEYLLRMTNQQRIIALRKLFKTHFPCLVVTRNRKVLPELMKLAVEFRVPIMRTNLITGTFINLATVIMENLMAPKLAMQGTMVDIMGIGVLIEGKPGIGKSEAALALIKRGHSLVADDLTMMTRTDERTIIGTAAGAVRYHLEIRGLGVIHVPSLFGVASVRDEKDLDLIVTLRKFDQVEINRLDLTPETRNVLGVSVPNLVIPVAPGRELAGIIEVATLNEKLKRLGHDAAKEFDDRLKEVLLEKAAKEER